MTKRTKASELWNKGDRIATLSYYEWHKGEEEQGINWDIYLATNKLGHTCIYGDKNDVVKQLTFDKIFGIMKNMLNKAKHPGGTNIYKEVHFKLFNAYEPPTSSYGWEWEIPEYWDNKDTLTFYARWKEWKYDNIYETDADKLMRLFKEQLQCVCRPWPWNDAYKQLYPNARWNKYILSFE